eukprot:scaffold493_cov88-Cylindrotheca_fusiformis.AAC.2
MSPCVIPRTTNPKKQKKIVPKTSLEAKTRGRTPKNVEMPPMRMDVPIVCIVSFTFASLVNSFDS